MSSSFPKDANSFIAIILDNKFTKTNQMGISDISIITLLSSMIDKVETISVLQEAKVTSEVKSILRSLIEQYIYFEYIFEKHSLDRSRSYFIHQRYEMFKNVKKMLDSCEKDESLRIKKRIDSIIRNDSSDCINADEAFTKYRNQFNDLFTRAKKKNGGTLNPKGSHQKNKKKWFNIDLDFTNTVYDLAKKTHQLTLYQCLYNSGSMTVHGVNATANFNVEKLDDSKELTEISLISGYDEKESLRLAIALTMRTILKVAHYYNIKKNSLPNHMTTKYKINIDFNRNQQELP